MVCCCRLLMYYQQPLRQTRSSRCTLCCAKHCCSGATKAKAECRKLYADEKAKLLARRKTQEQANSTGTEGVKPKPGVNRHDLRHIDYRAGLFQLPQQLHDKHTCCRVRRCCKLTQRKKQQPGTHLQDSWRGKPCAIHLPQPVLKV